METTITSNGRPRFRVLCTLLLGIAALWALPSIARAQLFVNLSRSPVGSVGEYDATTGATINASFITGLNTPILGLAISGHHLFVVHNSTTVGEYDATTGAAINAGFITGLNGPLGLAVSGNTLFVTDNGTVGEYNATTGAAINPRFITGLDEPDGLTVSGSTLFVSSFGSGLAEPSGTVGEYDVTTGTAVNASFITGLNGPTGLAVGAVPEPSPLSMMIAGDVALLGIMFRKKHRIR